MTDTFRPAPQFRSVTAVAGMRNLIDVWKEWQIPHTEIVEADCAIYELSIVPDDRYEIGERPPGEVVVRVCDKIAFVASVAMLMDAYTYHQRLNVGEEVKVTAAEINRKALKYPILCGRQDPICVQLLHTDSKHTLLARMHSFQDVR